MNNRTKTVVLLVVALLAVGALLLIPRTKRDVPSQVVSPPAIEQKEIESNISNGRKVTDGVLPSVHLPLRQTISQLKQMAANGNATAACRIAAEYQFCASAQSRMDRIDDIAMTQKGPDGNPLTVIRQVDPNLPSDSTHCDGVETTSSEQIATAWRRAAEMGNINAMTNYAVGHAFQNQNMLKDLDELKLYKNNAEKFASRSAELGDGGALLALAAAYAPQTHQLLPSMLTQAVNIDLQRSLTLYFLAQRRLPNGEQHLKLRTYIEEKIELLRKYANSEVINRASNEASALDSEWNRTVFPSESEIAALDRGRVRPLKLDACPDDNFR